jgi:16S rRNA (adenine1518-N6/adenine1519-N6)-dimethyltransferase
VNLTDERTIISLLQKHQTNTKKFLGQNFLISQQPIETIIEAAEVNKEDYIIEVGPGIGPLTQALADSAKEVTSLEIDKSLLTVLKDTLKDKNNVKIEHIDALKYDVNYPKYKVVANIPYNITSPLITHFLTQKIRPKSINLLIQKEVAEKITKKAPKHTVLSLQTALYGTASYVATVKRDKFHPAPKVDSAIIKIELFNQEDPNYYKNEEADKILKLAKQAFKQRRKKLKNTLSHLNEKLEALGFENKRPQELSPKDWETLLN